VPKDSLTVRFEDGSIEDIPLDTCSCGGTPCRHRAESAPVQGDDVVAATPTEPTGGACEPAAYAAAPPDLAASAVALSEADPVGERAEGQSDQGQTAEGEEAAPKRSRPRRRRRRPRSSGEGGEGGSATPE
jgi:hypothetical protein